MNRSTRLRAGGPEIVETGPDVWYSRGPLTVVGEEEFAFLKERAAESTRKRCRICLHAGPESPVHEMLIVHHRTCYVRPHMHPDKAESLLLVQGSARALFFDRDGAVEQVLRLEAGPGGAFSYRVGPGRIHSLLIESEWLVFYEVSQGPFSAASSAFPAWAPDGADRDRVLEFERRVAEEADRFAGVAAG